METDGLTIFQDRISYGMEVYYYGKRLPIRVVSMGEPDEDGEMEITISTVRGFPTTFTNQRPEGA